MRAGDAECKRDLAFQRPCLASADRFLIRRRRTALIKPPLRGGTGEEYGLEDPARIPANESLKAFPDLTITLRKTLTSAPYQCDAIG